MISINSLCHLPHDLCQNASEQEIDNFFHGCPRPLVVPLFFRNRALKLAFDQQSISPNR